MFFFMRATVLRTLSFAALLLVLGTPMLRAEAPLSYERDIAPIFRSYCAGCHNNRALEGGLSVETFAQLLKGGEDRGQTIQPGNPEESFLIKLMEGRARPHMPPRDEPQVPASDLARLKQWILDGAQGPAVDHSILQTLVTPKLPGAKGPQPITAAAYSKDGASLALARTGILEIRDVKSGEVRLIITNVPGKINRVQFSPDGRTVVLATGITGLRGVAQIRDAATGALVREFAGHSDILYDAEFSPDGALLATAGYDHFIHVWEVSDGALRWGNNVNKGAVFDLAWNPSGTVLASASADETVKLWRVSDGVRLDTLNQPQREVMAVAFTPDGQHILAAAADRRLYTWRFVTREAPGLNPMIHARFAHEAPISGMALSADGRHLLSTAADRSAKLWTLPELELRHAYDPQPDIAPVALAIPGKNEFFVARLDGSTGELPLLGSVQPAAPATDIASRFVPSGELKSYTEAEPNDAPANAQPITIPAEVGGAISRAGDADLFRFTARAGETIAFEINAARSKSRLDSRLEILHADGRPVEQVVLQAVRESWFTFRGKDSATSDDFRLHNWMEMELNEYLYANGEVVRLWLYPRGPDSGFKVYPGEGRRHSFFGTTPVVHALGAPAYIVQPLPSGSQPAPNGLPVFRLNYVNDDDSTRQWGADSLLMFTAPSDGDYLVRVTDVRGFGGTDGFHYKLFARAPRPNFQIAIAGLNPKVSPGSGRELRFTATRSEGFDGPIRIEIANLPPGFSSSAPVEIESGQIAAVAVLYADTDASDPEDAADQAVKVVAKAVIGSEEITRELGTLGNIQLGAAPKVSVEILPPDDGSNVTETAGQPLEFLIRPGQTIAAKVRAQRNGFDGRIELGGDDSGRNLPHGVYVDNIGLNGLLIVEGETKREFVITASPVARPGTRLFHLRATADGGQASRPAVIRVLGQ
jgi:hypothetical protein